MIVHIYSRPNTVCDLNPRDRGESALVGTGRVRNGIPFNEVVHMLCPHNSNISHNMSCQNSSVSGLYPTYSLYAESIEEFKRK